MTDPDDTPAARLDRYLAEHECDLPDRYRHFERRAASRPFGAFRVPPYGLALVLTACAVLALARALGYPIGP